MSTTHKPTARQREALDLVAQGHVEYGAEHPAIARRAARRNGLVMRTFVIDGRRKRGGAGKADNGPSNSSVPHRRRLEDRRTRPFTEHQRGP